MAANHRIHLTDSDDMQTRDGARAQFARKLYTLMAKKGWRQADLARAANLPRDNVSRYIRGASGPTPENLTALANAFGIKNEDLWPHFMEDAIERDTASVEIKTSVASPNTAWLRVNRPVKLSTALKIAELLEADESVAPKAANGD